MTHPISSLLALRTLEQAIARDDLALLKLALKRGESPNRLLGDGYPVLHAAIRSTRNDGAGVVATLIAAGADIEARAGDRTPLMTACMAGRVHAVEALVRHGARLDEVDADGWTAMMWATAGPSNYYREQCLHFLIGAGADAGVSSTAGTTLLMLAAGKGMPQVVRKLIDAGVDVCKRNASKLRASDCAMQGAYRGEAHRQCQQMLLMAESVQDMAVDLDVETPAARPAPSRGRRL